MTLIGILVAFASGIFGAAMGALPAFIMVGFLVLAGVAIQAAGGGGDYLGTVAFGAWGPHVGGFASGVAAVAYASSRGKHETGRDILAGMMGKNSPDVLLIGGIFGIIGYVLNWLFALPGAWTDTIALSVVVSAIIARFAFGQSGLMGKVPSGASRYSPPEANCWVPWQSKPMQLLMLGLGAGTFSAYLALSLPDGAGVVLGFGMAAASLVFLQFGTQVPVSHHVALPAAVAAAASGSLLWGMLFGVMAAFVGEFMANTFCSWGDTHIDPPAATIWPMTSLSILLGTLGIYQLVPLF
ncbi:MAG: permease [Anaerolineae bacterium]|nr:permease [Anaerolineae bacterium]